MTRDWNEAGKIKGLGTDDEATSSSAGALRDLITLSKLEPLLCSPCWHQTPQQEIPVLSDSPPGASSSTVL